MKKKSGVYVEETTVKLTRTDRAILQSYVTLCEGFSDYMGDGYEIVLHSLENFDKSVIKIINGYYTGRKEGAPITDLALNMLKQVRAQQNAGYISYFSKNKKGEPLKSTTITIRGENDRIIGLLCINFYLNTPFSKVLGNFTMPQSGPETAGRDEIYVDNSEDLISETVLRAREEILADISVPASNKNREIISKLYDRGIFNLKDSVIKCAELLGISKNTVYMHIRNLSR